jgi:hypothetical protein
MQEMWAYRVSDNSMKDEIDAIMWCVGVMIVCVVLAIVFKV